MANCLGIFIEKNIIKYAKVSQDHNLTKIEAFGVKINDNLEPVEQIVEKIVNETYSFNVPISTNISDEKYAFINLCGLLSQKDLDKSAETEFEYYCNENGKKKQALQYKHINVDHLEDKDKCVGLYVYIDQANMVTKLQSLDKFHVGGLYPTSVVMGELLSQENHENCMIVNIENQTTVTTFVNGKIHRVDTINKGMKNIFELIAQRENSYSKAYEVCKNSTIYTTSGLGLQTEENEYLEDIMPTLYEIVTDVKDIMITNGVNIEKIYLTGLATVINNIDLYFGENFEQQNCEILIPYFVNKSNIKINIKDYIEVNSAIALALRSLGKRNKEMNFKKEGAIEKFVKAFSGNGRKVQKKQKQEKTEKNKRSTSIKQVFGRCININPSNKVNVVTYRVAYSLCLLLIVYVIISTKTVKMINQKTVETQEIIGDTQVKIAEIEDYTSKVNKKKESYQTIINRINEANNAVSEQYASKNAIPNLLNNIMFAIPKPVQVTLIQNVDGKNIEIDAQSEKYEQLGIFVAKLKNDALLANINVDEGRKEDGVVKIRIKGDLPY